MMRKQVLHYEQPKVIGFLGHAYVLGALNQNEDYLPWYYSNYIQLYFSGHYLDIGEYRLDFFPDLLIVFYGVPWLEYHRMTKLTLERHNIDIHAFIKDYIDRGYYFISYADEFYIPKTYSYQKYHFAHDLFVYGYDEEKRVYHIAGYNGNNYFDKWEIGFDDLEAGYYANTRGEYISLFRKVDPSEYTRYRFGLKCGCYDFDLSFVVGALNEYLHGINSSQRLRMQQMPEPGLFGIQVYGGLREYFRLLGEGKKPCDIRAPHILWEHKTTMVARIDYLIQNGYLPSDTPSLDAYTKVERQVFKIRSLVIKYSMVPSPGILNLITTYLHEAEEMERTVLAGLIDELVSHNGLQPPALQPSQG